MAGNAAEKTVFFVRLAVEGIQKYIFSTGKLKEMIGGSEIINFLASPDFYGPLLDDRLGLREAADFQCEEGRYIVAQANAGVLCLILPEERSAKEFLRLASEYLLSAFPGLPFYGALEAFSWSDDVRGREAYDAARKRAEDAIAGQRNRDPVAVGAPLLPILQASRLDGLPAVRREISSGQNPRGELLSLPSLARCSPDMLQRSRDRLRENVEAPEGVVLDWKDNLEEMLEGEGRKVALICLDGNDLGKLFGRVLRSSGDMTLSQCLRERKALSRTIQRCNTGAFVWAASHIARYELESRRAAGRPAGHLLMPLRPLVMGGDDIAVIARADIALAFVSLFASRFEALGRETGLSIGIGMVVMPAGYPFAKAFPLAETLQDSAKKLTRDLEPGKRPSSIDYLVLTEDVENDAELVRERLLTTPDTVLTTKPLLFGAEFTRLLDCGHKVIACLPRSQIREAWTTCRQGPKATKKEWLNLKENIARRIGGRKGRLLSMDEFVEIFPENFFVSKNGAWCSPLGDYLELEHLLPGDEGLRAHLFAIMGEKADV